MDERFQAGVFESKEWPALDKGCQVSFIPGEGAEASLE
jgi:hypothetical protein